MNSDSLEVVMQKLLVASHIDDDILSSGRFADYLKTVISRLDEPVDWDDAGVQNLLQACYLSQEG